MINNFRQWFLSFIKNNTEIFLRLILLGLVLGLLVYVFSARLVKFSSEQGQTIESVVETIESIVNKGAGQGSPLVASSSAPSSFLTANGVIEFTNQHRAENGLPPLAVNSKLTQSAQVKVADMFAKQYFEHDSPTGVGVNDLVKDQSYAYLIVGENLALGNFANDAVLVQGWMDSPGHRANILKSEYKEIGVYVLRGSYEGRSTWLAVQHFGRPISDCPQPDAGLKSRIDSNENTLDIWSADLERRKAEIEADSPSNPGYNQKVDEYNQKVSEFNALVEVTKAMIAEYNNHVKNFNACAGS